MRGFLSGRDARAACRGARRSERTSKPAPSSRLAQRAAGEEAQVRARAGRSGARSPPAAIGRRGGAAVRRRGHRQRAARAQHAARLGQEQLHVAHVLERLGAEHEVEARVGERQRRVGRRAPPRAAAGTRRAARVERHRATRRPASARRARSSTASRPSPQPRSRALLHRRRASARSARQVLRRRRPVVGHQLPELVVVAAGYQAPLALITAGTVFSRIERSRNTDQCSR